MKQIEEEIKNECNIYYKDTNRIQTSKDMLQR